MSKKNRKMNQVVEPQVTEDVETAEEVEETTTEVVEFPKKKDGLLKKVKTGAENLALDAGLWWGRNKKKFAIALGIACGVLLAGLALSEKDDGEGESDYELSDEEVDDVDSSNADTSETEDGSDTESETAD